MCGGACASFSSCAVFHFEDVFCAKCKLTVFRLNLVYSMFLYIVFPRNRDLVKLLFLEVIKIVLHIGSIQPFFLLEY